MTYEEDLALFRQTFPPSSDRGTNHPDPDSLIWELEKTVEQHPEKWGWLDPPCQVCGENAVVIWDREKGYRCDACRIF